METGYFNSISRDHKQNIVQDATGLCLRALALFYMMRVRFSCFTLLYLSVAVAWAQRFPLVTPTDKACILYDTESSPVDSVAAVLFAQDIYRVSGYSPTVITKPSQISGNVIVIGTVTSRYVKELLRDTLPLEKTLNGKWETYAYRVVNNAFATGSRAFVIAGSDPRGTAYGVLDLSQKIGVSPWYWWADVPVQKKSELSLEQSSFASSPPSVKYRGIFLNDEDWGLLPWASKTFDPQKKNIGPKTYERIFELLLRLKGNIIWPAMHPGSEPFFYDPGNIQMAEAYGIVIGTSHAEPMLRNNVGEWDKTSRGDFNYLTNRLGVLKYWDERVSQTTSINAIYTLGMRGVHDSKMEGVKDLKEAVPYLEKIISEQRDLLEKYRKRPAAEIPQVFTAYKEVLEIYDYGLKLPDDVTLVWPDDNYGYIQRLNTPKEAARTGGSGVYYHASYWGRPHDYLWLGTTHPALMRSELMKAYESGATTLWVLNVGDIKPLEYQVQLFMDMANNALPFKDSRQVKRHLDKWTVGIFGDHAGSIADVLMQSYDLAFSRRPEFVGWSQTEPTTKTRYTAFNHFYFGDEGQRRIDEYNSLQRSVRKIRNDIPQVFQDAFYELVYYPVVGASLINKKFLYRDKAFLYSKQNRFISTYYAESSNQAFDSIALETD